MRVRAARAALAFRGKAVVTLGVNVAAAVLLIALPSAGLASAQSSETQLPAAATTPASTTQVGDDIADLRTRTTLTYRAQHGSYETHAYAESVNYRDEAGEWRRIDNALRNRGNVVTNGANRYTLTIPKALESGAFRVAERSTWVEFDPRGVDPTRVETTGSQASFPDAWPGVELTYTADADVVKEALIVEGPAYVRDFAFDMRLAHGLTPRQLASGAILLRDPAGATRMTIAPAYMVDAAGAYANTPMTLTRNMKGWVLRIKPDAKWLNAESRRWPVTIDPTVSIGGALSCLIQRGGDGTSTGACGVPLIVGESYECDAASHFPPNYCEAMRALVRFDIANALPAGAVVEHAELVVNDSGSPNGLDVYEVTAPWTGTVDWNTRNGVAPWTPGSGGVSGGAQHDRAWAPYPMTELVRAWATGERPNNGLLFASRYTFASTRIHRSPGWMT